MSTNTPQDTYTDALKGSQEAFAGAFDSWTKATQQAFGFVPTTPFPGLDPGLVIDQVYDFAGRLLETQRQFTKSLIAASTQMSETVRQSAESAAHSAADSANKTAKSTANATK
jgi:hypothetical protein